ncbi:MAG: glycosyltransferase family 39 protein [Kiritimatiellaceae bacterium]|nr:glycosyltransferase family 39 protein [Kiritimatiellaceae bacterium]
MKQMLADLKLPLLLVTLISLCAVLVMPITPIDETRYLSVAWEMWNHHSFLVPYLNGEPYSHKPPLLFWLLHAGWALFGVNDFTPRMIPGIFSLLNLLLVYRISLRLWPQERKTAFFAGLILATTSIWDAWSIVIMFDMVLTFWILLGLLGTLRAADSKRGGWLMLAAGITGGLLTKGPAVLVYLLSVPLLRAAWDTRRATPVRAKWYFGILGAVALGFAAALLWVIPAAIQGGETYRQAILWGQTAGRITSSFAHRLPFWFYLPIVPVLFFPWILFRPSFAKLSLKSADTGTRFCLAWLALPLLVFSMISGKQVHYLIPFIPAGALLIGRNIAKAEGTAGKRSVKAFGILFLLLGLIAPILPFINLGEEIGKLPSGSTYIASAGLLTASLLLLIPFRSSGNYATRLAVSMTLVLIFGLFEAKKSFMENYDIKEVAIRIRSEMDAGHAVANMANYHGQYQFLGRLTQPIAELEENPDAINNFAASNSGALFISYKHKEDALPEGAEIWFTHKYRGRNVVLWHLCIAQP